MIVFMMAANAASRRNIQMEQDNEVSIIEDVDTISPSEAIADSLYDAVHAYVSSTSKRLSDGEHHEITSSIIENALAHDIDICFMLAQGTRETHLGSYGIGKSRHSIFGIGRRYESYSDSVDDYVATLKKYYIKRRTTDELLQNYVTSSGARYAEAEGYEAALRSSYYSIRRTTDIHRLQSLLNEAE